MTLVFFVWLVTFPALAFVTTAMHEAGHLVAGRLVGYRFHSIRVWRVCIGQEGGRLRIYWIKDALRYGGLAQMLPCDERCLRLREAVMVAGGPVANLIGGVLSIAMVYLLQVEVPSGPAPYPHLHSLLFIGGGCSLVFFVITLFAQEETDGATLRRLLLGGAEADRHCALVALARRVAGGERPRDWPAELIQSATVLSDGTAEEITSLLYAYYWAIGRRDLAGARQFLNRALAASERVSAVVDPDVYFEAAYFAARFCGDTAAARAFLDKAGEGGKEEELTSTRSRAEAAVRLAERDGEAAVVRAGQMVAAFRRLRLEDGD